MTKIVYAVLAAVGLAAIGFGYYQWSHPSLRAAVRAGNATRVERALRNGADPNERNTFPPPVVGSRKEEPILCSAAAQGSLEVVRLLLAHGATVEDPGHEGLTPVGVAARYGHRELVTFLCERGVDVKASRFGKTALNESLLRNDFPTAEILIRHGALIEKPGERSIVGATWSHVVQGSCNLPAMKFLIAQGVDVNTLEYSLSLDPSGVNRKPGTALPYIRRQIDRVQKRIDNLDYQINGPRKAQLQDSLAYENKNLAVYKEAEQVLLAAGAKE